MNNQPTEQTICVWGSEGQDAELAAIHGALYVLLGEMPLMTDYAQCTQIPRKDFPNQYTLVYKKKALGIIRKIYSAKQPQPYKVSFTPLAILN